MTPFSLKDENIKFINLEEGSFPFNLEKNQVIEIHGPKQLS
jgi:hypothetical protein